MAQSSSHLTDITMYTPVRDYLAHKTEYDEAIQNVLTVGNFIGGSPVVELEKKLAQFVGVKHCITMANGTDALLVALMALGIGQGDEVITVAHTWISSSEVISLLGAIPVFIDINPNTFVMDLDLIEGAITQRTKCIMPVSLYGNMVDMEKLRAIAEKHRLFVIEDGAQSFGSLTSGKRRSCSFKDIGCTSFFPSKPLGAYGDAGACFTDNDVFAGKLKAIKNHGGLVRFKHDYIGLNSRLDTLQASILLVKLKYFEEALNRRRSIAKFYNENLSGVVGLKTPEMISGLESAWAQYSLLVVDDRIKRDDVVAKLKEVGIQVSIFYPVGLHEQKCFSYLAELVPNYGVLPKTDYVCSRILNIPLFAELTQEEMEKIVDSLKKIFSS